MTAVSRPHSVEQRRHVGDRRVLGIGALVFGIIAAAVAAHVPGDHLEVRAERRDLAVPLWPVAE